MSESSSVDLSLCKECWTIFDDGEHQPKFLNKCPIHPLVTICLHCLKSGKLSTNTCKSCRNACESWALDELPVNVYALQLAQLIKTKAETEVQISQVPEPTQIIEQESRWMEQNGFTYLECPFVFKFSLAGVDLGDVHVMSSPFIIQHKFVQALGEFCYRTPKEFYVGKPKFIPGSFYELECHHPDFQPLEFDLMIYADPSKVLIANEQLSKLDAAIEPVFNEEGKLIKWKFLFTFKDFDQSKKSSETIWGTITEGHSLLEWLTTRDQNVDPGISFTLETRNLSDPLA